MFEMLPWVIAGVAGVGGFIAGRAWKIKQNGPVPLAADQVRSLNEVPQANKGRYPLPNVASSSGIPDYASTILGVTASGPDAPIKYFVAAGSRRGASHIESGLPRQDNFAVISKDGLTYIVLSDGVSSAEDAQIGSTFLVQNFERILDETFTAGFSEDIALWQELNKKLSQNLVAMHVSRAKREGKQVADSVENLRRDAAKLYAATLEVLVCWQKGSAAVIDYFAVRLAGDGKLFKISDCVEDLQLGGALDGNIKVQSVRALPIYDGTPITCRGEILSGEAIALTTDGIGDFLQVNAEWSRALESFCSKPSPSEHGLLEVIGHSDANSRDDRTIGLVINAK
jgi:hypothetical protein